MLLRETSRDISSRAVPMSDSERGSALIAVLGLMAVAAVVALVISGATVHAMGYTTATRAGVQAEAAAFAGIDAARVDLAKGNCQAEYTGTDPKYTVEVTSYSPGTDGDKWPAGCPTDSTIQRIKLTSTGYAASKGVAGQSAGDSRTLEAVYSTGTGPAMYSYSSAGYVASGTLSPGGGITPSVQIKHGDAKCSGGNSISGNLVIEDGNLTVSGSCSIHGSVYASGTVTISGGGITVDGDIVGSAVSIAGVHVKGSVWSTAGSVAFPYGSTVDGSVAANTSVALAGTLVRGSVWAQTSASLSSDSIVDGDVTAESISGPGSVKGTKTSLSGGPIDAPAPPIAPVVPNWIDYTLDRNVWAGMGYQVVSISGAECDTRWDKGTLGVYDEVVNATKPVVVDAMACTDGYTVSSSQPLPIHTNVAIFARKFSLGSGGSMTAASAHKVWLIVPDSTPDSQPSCPGSAPSAPAGDITLSGSFSSGSNLSVMLYTPCTASVGAGAQWKGQVFTGKTGASGAGKLSYFPVGLPGYDLDNGTTMSPKSLIGTKTFIRDVNAG